MTHPSSSAGAGMRLSGIWRYPVKSMGGETLHTAWLGDLGITGDRIAHVVDGQGRLITSRSKPRLLLHHARLGPNGEPTVDGRPWTSEEVSADVERAAGKLARLRLSRLDGPVRFDVLPLLVATDGAIAAFGYDPRRLRPNLIISGVPGLAERTWERQMLRVGGAVIGVASLRQRCIMTTFDPDTAEQDKAVLLKIWDDFEGRLALDCRVLQAGLVRVGDRVEMLAASEAG